MNIMVHNIIYNKFVYLIPKKVKHTTDLYPGRLNRILTKKVSLSHSIYTHEGCTGYTFV